MRADDQTLAVTATATPAVITDIRQSLRMKPSDAVFKETFDRPNLSYSVHVKGTMTDDLKHVAACAMDASSHQPTIVYVNTRAMATTVVQTLERMGVTRVAGYTGEDSALRRQHVHEMFLSDGAPAAPFTHFCCVQYSRFAQSTQPSPQASACSLHERRGWQLGGRSRPRAIPLE